MSDYYNLTKEQFRNLPDNNLINFNNLKVKEVLIKIALCRLMGIPFVIRAIDIDDTLNKTEPLIQENLKSIDYTVTQEYFDKEIKGLPGKEKRAFIEEFYKNLDEVLEQRRVGEKRINYRDIHRPENLFPNTIKYLNELTTIFDTDASAQNLTPSYPERAAGRNYQMFEQEPGKGREPNHQTAF